MVSLNFLTPTPPPPAFLPTAHPVLHIKEVFPLGFRSICQEVFYKIGALKSFLKFMGKHLCWSPFLIKFQACFPEGFAKFSRTLFL